MTIEKETASRWWLAVPTALVVLIVNVLLHVLYMVLYGYVLSPGHEPAYYQSHAQASGPYSSIVFGIPLMFLAGRWIARRFPSPDKIKAAIAVWLVYFVIDLTIIGIVGALLQVGPLVAVSFATKLVAAYLGGRSSPSA